MTLGGVFIMSQELIKVWCCSSATRHNFVVMMVSRPTAGPVIKERTLESTTAALLTKLSPIIRSHLSSRLMSRYGATFTEI